MCLTTKAFKTRQEAEAAIKKPHIALADLLVYKKLSKGNKAPYRSAFTYVKGGQYTATLGKRITWRDEIEVNRGLHAFLTEKDAKASCTGGERVVKMVIPRGARFFVGNDDRHIVATKLEWR